VTEVLVLGATGMLGSAMVRLLSADPALAVTGAARAENPGAKFTTKVDSGFIGGLDVERPGALEALFAQTRPDVVINCVGLVKQHDEGKNERAAATINSELPHQLLELCRHGASRLIHVSTDCVFDGNKGNYRESERPDATDVYGLSKFRGEVSGPGAITLRTSIIGYELGSKRGLLEWFLEQGETCPGYTQAIFSGMPTVELARVVRDFVLPRPELEGLYHVSAKPIVKIDLLKLLAAEYGKEIEILPDESVQYDRSLNSERFRAATSYVAPSWPDLVKAMHEFGRA